MIFSSSRGRSAREERFGPPRTADLPWTGGAAPQAWPAQGPVGPCAWRRGRWQVCNRPTASDKGAVNHPASTPKKPEPRVLGPVPVLRRQHQSRARCEGHDREDDAVSGRSRGHRITGLWESLGGAAGAGRGRWPGELAAARLPLGGSSQMEQLHCCHTRPLTTRSCRCNAVHQHRKALGAWDLGSGSSEFAGLLTVSHTSRTGCCRSHQP